MQRKPHAMPVEESGAAYDGIDETIALWGQSLPDVDLAPLSVILRISRLEILFADDLQRFLRPYGVGPGEMDVMFSLLRRPPRYEQRPSDIAKGCHVTTGATTGRVNRLISSGLVERAGESRDRRESLVRLTARGRKLALKLRRESASPDFLALALERMGSNDRGEFLRLLRKFSILVEQLRGNG